MLVSETALLLALASCGVPATVTDSMPVAEPSAAPAAPQKGSGLLADAGVPEAFNFSTSREVTVAVTVLGPGREPMSGVGVTILDDAGNVINRGMTDSNGVHSGRCTVPVHIAELEVRISLIGLGNTATVPIADDGTVTYTFE